MSLSDINDIVEEVTRLIQKNKIDMAIIFISGKLQDFPEDSFEYNRLLVLRAECYQMKGVTSKAIDDINSININCLPSEQLIDLKVLSLKIQTQQGHFEEAASLIANLQKEKGFELPNSTLWRGALANATQDDIATANLLKKIHKEKIRANSFQEANNILYADIIPNILYQPLSNNISKVLTPIEISKDIYLNSTLDYKGRIGNRLKSYSQALLVEAFVNYSYNNKFNAYTQVMTAGLLLRDCCVKRNAEGIGEILYSLEYKKTPLYNLLCISMDKELLSNKNFVDLIDGNLIKKAAIASTEIVADLLQVNIDCADNVNKLDYSFCNIKEGNTDMLIGFDKLKNCHDDNEVVLKKLISAIRRNSVVPFFGAGISAWAYPLWSDLLLNLGRDFGVYDEVKNEIYKGEFENAASIIETEAGNFDFNNKIKEKFDTNILKNKEIPVYLKKIKNIWKGTIITTNFDHVLDYIYDYKIHSLTPHSNYEEIEISTSIQQNTPLIIKLHGDINNVCNLIITKEQYDNAYGNGKTDMSKIIPRVLSKVLTSKTVLFLGCSLSNDRTLNMIYNSIELGVEQYALVELPKETENVDNPFLPKLIGEDSRLLIEYTERRKYFSKHHINRIWYPYGKHEEAVRELIDGIYDNK